MTITEFLEARISEDEADAINRVVLRSEDRRSLTGEDAEKIHAECAAKRAIIEGIIPERDPQAGDPDYDPLWILRALAAVYRDHHDYQETWG